jgi:prefoldin subunit 5
MRISRKLYTTLIITVLTISAVMAAIPMVSAEIVGNPFLCASFPPGSTTPLTTGPPGTSVAVVGNATGGRASPFATVSVYWEDLLGDVLATGAADNNGDYRITVTIPEDTFGTHWIVVNDGETESGGAPFSVTPTLSVASIPPAYYGPTLALPGDDLTVSGSGFAPNDDITLFLNSTTLLTPASYVIVAPTFHTNTNGTFSGTITVPTIPMANFDVYVFNATDEAGNTATDMVTIDYYITCFPGSGPTGINIMIYGRIASDVAYDLRFNGALIATGTSGSDGSYMEFYTIPAVLSPGTYPIDIWWALTEVRSVNFTVTVPPTITLGATSGVAGDVVTITGANFVMMADITLYFDSTIVNSTDMGTGFGPCSVFGSFSEEFVVPTLTPGIYTVLVVDSWGATSQAGVFFTITPTPLITVETRATQYYRHDVISLYTWTNVVPTYDIMWQITDPTGNIYIQGYIYYSDWYMISMNNYMVPYYIMRISSYWNNQIPDDAPVGVWNFTAYNSGTSAIVDTNLFSVNAKPTLQTVLDAIDECCANMTDLLLAVGANITEMKGEVATIETTVGEINVAIADLDATITSIDDGVANIDTTLGPISTQLTNLDATISGLDGDLVTIQTSIGGVQTSLDELDAVVGAMYGDVVTINTTVGTINGTITDMDGTIATIYTELGTLRMDVAEMKTNVADVKTNVDESLPVAVDMMPVWIAVVLSLIAAIAAIFAVVTIRQKIAG